MLLAFSNQHHEETNSTDCKQDQVTTLSLQPKSVSTKGTTSGQILVRIGSSSKIFFIEKLTQLSYFRARFSSRWNNRGSNVQNDLNEVQIFPSSDKNDNKFNYNQVQFNFICDDLELLLKCFELSKIPENSCLELNRLESLLYCNDYLNSDLVVPVSGNNAFVMNEATLIEYFRNRVPSLCKVQRDTFLSDCKHPVLRNALTKLIDEYENVVKESQSDFFGYQKLSARNENAHPTKFIRSLLKSVELDPIAATKIFESKFSMFATYQRGERKHGDNSNLDELSDEYIIYMGLSSFVETRDGYDYGLAGSSNQYQHYQEHQSILWDLWELCERGKYLSALTFKHIDDMMNVVLNKSVILSPITMITSGSSANIDVQSEIAWLIFYVLHCLTKSLMKKQLSRHDRRLRNTENISIVGLTCTRLMILARCTLVFKPHIVVHGNEFDYMTISENEQVANCIFQMSDKYFPVVSKFDDTLDELKISKNIMDDWIEFLRNVLLKCSKEFVTKKTDKWFPILHAKKREWYITAMNYVKLNGNYTHSQMDDNYNDSDQQEKDNEDENKKEDECFNDVQIEEILELNRNYESKMAQWIIENLIKTTDQCFDFGIFLSKYFVYEHHTNRSRDKKDGLEISFPQIYVDFMKDHCGISWKLL